MTDEQSGAEGDGEGLPTLSICIPTYNRAHLLVPMVQHLLDSAGDFEILVRNDGSNDDTIEELSRLTDRRLHVSSGPNIGRAGALKAAVLEARGLFTMLFDDDDYLSPAGLQQVLADCRAPLPRDVIGFIYHLADENGARIGSPFPVERSNFLELRNDLHVRGDKKEVVRSGPLKRAVNRADATSRRVPTSFYWSVLALSFDVICRNELIGQKNYHAGGMTHKNRRLRWQNPKPMVDLYAVQLQGFAKRRFRSAKGAAKAVVGMLWYSSLSLMPSGHERRRSA